MIDVQNGDYSRRFERDAQPFDVTEKEARLLKGIDDLQPVPEVTETQNEEQTQGDENTKPENAEQSSEEDASASEGERQSDELPAETSPAKATRRTRTTQPAK